MISIDSNPENFAKRPNKMRRSTHDRGLIILPGRATLGSEI
jgi:hypothetical protein